jgi:hypothetical protein
LFSILSVFATLRTSAYWSGELNLRKIHALTERALAITFQFNDAAFSASAGSWTVNIWAIFA